MAALPLGSPVGLELQLFSGRTRIRGSFPGSFIVSLPFNRDILLAFKLQFLISMGSFLFGPDVGRLARLGDRV